MKLIFSLLAALSLSACGGGTTVPDWQINAQTAMQRYTQYFLQGQVQRADASFSQARKAVAATGNIDAVAHLELVRCGLHTAALDFTPCSGYNQLAALTSDPADAAYARFISGDWQGLNRALLPPQYAAFAAAAAGSAESQPRIRAISDPVSRLIATGLAVRRGKVDDATLQAAVDTASAQGWRRPLLTYLKLQQQRSTDPTALAALCTRIRLVEESLRSPVKNVTAAP
jgi:hypothetical protein